MGQFKEILGSDGKAILGNILTGQILGPGGVNILGRFKELLGPDGKALLGQWGQILGNDGKSILGKMGELLGPDGKPLKPLRGADGELLFPDKPTQEAPIAPRQENKPQKMIIDQPEPVSELPQPKPKIELPRILKPKK